MRNGGFYMKATGIVRRIDELGRIVIPKEIRKQLKINEGQSLEIYMNDKQEIILKKYSEFSRMEKYCFTIMDTLAASYGINVMLANLEKIIYVTSPNKKAYEGKELARSMVDFIARRKALRGNHFEIIPLVRETQETCILPLNDHGELLGALFFMSEQKELDTVNEEILTYSKELLLKAMQ